MEEQLSQKRLILSDKQIGIATTAVTLLMVAVHLLYSQFFTIMSNELYLTLHMTLSCIIMFLLTMKKVKSNILQALLLLGILACVVCTVYIGANVDGLRMRVWASTPMDLVIGVVLIVVAYVAAVLGYGWFVPIIVFVVMIYPFFGQHFPEPFNTIAYPLTKTISNLSISLQSGLYDKTLSISANYVFLFSVFGGILAATGVQAFFYEFGKLTVGRFKSGNALIATLNAALVGMVVGSAVANASIVGPYTIKPMKKDGYTSVQAGSILAAAANGGQILPPVMGIIAFAMAGFSGISYFKICQMAILSAILYYLIIAVYCQLTAMKTPALRDRERQAFTVDKKMLLYRGILFLVPFSLIIVMFAMGYSVMNVGFWATMVTIVISFVMPKMYRPKVKDIIDGFVDGGIGGAKIGCICAVIGILVQTFTSSGLGVKLTAGIEGWANGNLFIALLILWVVSVIAGMAGVSVAAYFTAAAFAVPVLVKMGVPFEVAHFFIVYPAAFSTITPPVALASLVASQFAEAPYVKTAAETCRVAAPGFIVPFLFAYSPALMLMQSPMSLIFWVDLFMIFFGFIVMQISFVGFFVKNINYVLRGALLCASAAMILYIALRQPWMGIVGVLAAVLILLYLFITNKRKKHSAAV